MGTVPLINSAGGAEKVFCNMANEFMIRGHEVLAVCNDYRQGKPFYPLHEKVNFHNLDASGVKRKYPRSRKIFLWKIWRAVCKPFRKTFLEPFFRDPIEHNRFSKLSQKLMTLIQKEKPDIVILFFVDDYYALNYHKQQNIPQILMHHGNSDVFLKYLTTNRKSKMVKQCPCVQFLLPGYAKKMASQCGSNIVAIPNVVPQIDDSEMADLSCDKNDYTITMISRLESEKNQTLLIECFSLLARDYPNWKLKFFGATTKPEYFQLLQNLIEKYHLENQIFLAGTTTDPLEELQKADIFAFPSLYEGFPLALTEAMSVGLPCIGLKTASGVNELIVNEVNGFLADNSSEDFAAKLKILMDNQELRVKMGKVGHEMVKQFAPKTIWDTWENLLLETIGTKPLKSGLFSDKITS